MYRENFIRKLLSEGQHWRAKEHCQGRLSSTGFDAELYEAYGFVLLEMRDLVEAGKYLFLSGVRKDEYSEAIELFLRRFGQRGSAHLFHTFPKSARASDITSYPDQVMRELEKLNFKSSDLRTGKNLYGPPPKQGFLGTLVGTGVLVLIVALVIGFLVSAFQGLVWLFSFATGGE